MMLRGVGGGVWGGPDAIKKEAFFFFLVRPSWCRGSLLSDGVMDVASGIGCCFPGFPLGLVLRNNSKRRRRKKVL